MILYNSRPGIHLNGRPKRWCMYKRKNRYMLAKGRFINYQDRYVFLRSVFFEFNNTTTVTLPLED